jgi:Fe-S cluster assembly ATP-binding protein
VLGIVPRVARVCTTTVGETLGRYAGVVPTPVLEADDLWVEADGVPILRGVSLSVGPGELHVIMGPNGSGKSSFANVVMGNPAYQITKGSLRYQGLDIRELPVDERAKAGIFLAFQDPQAINGVSVVQFLRQALSARRGEEVSVLEVRFALGEWLERLGFDPSFAQRHLNEGFSGGERKRNEVIQMALLEPTLAILDETDSGLDVDALRIVAEGIELVRGQHPEMAVVLITHYQRVLSLLSPTHIHVLLEGRVVASGGLELAQGIEQGGYQSFRSQEVVQ